MQLEMIDLSGACVSELDQRFAWHILSLKETGDHIDDKSNHDRSEQV